MQEMVAINILLGDRTYRIRIEPKNEETVRKAVKVINDKVMEFKNLFIGKDMQDYIAMVLVWFASQHMGQSQVPAYSEDMLPKLNAMESALDKALSRSSPEGL
jgi:cell division protein ZapA